MHVRAASSAACCFRSRIAGGSVPAPGYGSPTTGARSHRHVASAQRGAARTRPHGQSGRHLLASSARLDFEVGLRSRRRPPSSMWWSADFGMVATGTVSRRGQGSVRRRSSSRDSNPVEPASPSPRLPGARLGACLIAVALGCAWGTSSSRAAPAGAPDPTFGTGGVVTYQLGFGNDSPFSRLFAVVPAPEGKIDVAGDAGDGLGDFQVLSARLQENGSLDGSHGVQLLGGLPPVIELRGAGDQSLVWLDVSAQMLVRETTSPSQGSTVMVSVDRLAAKSNLSRSAFAERFARRAGQPPAAYITELRLVTATSSWSTPASPSRPSPQTSATNQKPPSAAHSAGDTACHPPAGDAKRNRDKRQNQETMQRLMLGLDLPARPSQAVCISVRRGGSFGPAFGPSAARRPGWRTT
jgi:AraC-like DNA-binding protein